MVRSIEVGDDADDVRGIAPGDELDEAMATMFSPDAMGGGVRGSQKNVE